MVTPRRQTVRQLEPAPRPERRDENGHRVEDLQNYPHDNTTKYLDLDGQLEYAHDCGKCFSFAPQADVHAGNIDTTCNLTHRETKSK